MTNNTIKRHLVLHICEDILDHGVPDNVNSAYAESAHITLAKVTSQNTQKRALSFTKQAAHRYIENLVVSLASADVKNYIKSKDREVRHFQVFSRSFYIQTIPGRGTWPDLPEVYLAPAVTY
jgi:hypothetical protein